MQDQDSGCACDLMGNPNCSTLILKDSTLWKGPRLEQIMNYVPWERLHAASEEQHEEEGAAETKCYELKSTPIPLHLLNGSR